MNQRDLGSALRRGDQNATMFWRAVEKPSLERTDVKLIFKIHELVKSSNESCEVVPALN
jgi:hypothetical protein